MDSEKLASGDSKTLTLTTEVKETSSPVMKLDLSDTNNSNEEVKDNNDLMDICNMSMNDLHKDVKDINDTNQDAISPKTLEENEIKLKERVEQCKNIIATLRLELNEEKIKLEKEAKKIQIQPKETPHRLTPINTPISVKGTDFPNLCDVNLYSASVDSKLNCDKNLMEYEKQLQRYQNTLTMAQIEKKNAIRKQMLAKAFKLKLMEVENQCNVELLRIKQSLQCLEPLHMIVEKWKDSSNDNSYDLNNFELIPRYPELSANSGSDIMSFSSTDEFENKITD